MDYAAHLLNLRLSLIDQRTSLIVGSGFSKNASDLFPTWGELIEDLVYELFKDEIDVVLSGIDEKRRDSALRAEVWKFINREGYLGVVSKYIRHKGYDECIVTYIEERTPIILGEDDQYYFIQDGKRVAVTVADLKLHRLLLELPWNNVYTTNYDPLLEASVKVGLHQEKGNENVQLNKKLVALEGNLLTDKQRRDELTSERDNITFSEIYRLERGPIGPDKAPDPSTGARLKEIMDELTKVADGIHSMENEKVDIEKTIVRNNQIINNSYTVVTAGAQLALKRNRNIIKLHGSLRTEADRKKGTYGFDGDARKQYVIASEHYDDYPKKHEAFTQLMRISLLQESFCLIGFSGDDPNFLAWIRWVRDLLYRSNGNDGAVGAKIFLIEVTKREIDQGKQLFYDNHRIARIPLLFDEVIDFLEGKVGVKVHDRKDAKSIIELFLRFLYGNDQIVSPVIPYDSTLASRWRETWTNIFDWGGSQTIKVGSLRQTSERLEDIAAGLSALDLNNWITHSQFRFLDQLARDNYELPGVEKKVVESLIYMAVNTSGVPVPFLLPPEMLDGYRQRFGESAERDMAIAQPENDVVWQDIYAKILKLAFYFEFKKYKELLDEWEPGIREVHLKAGLWAEYDRDASIRMLERQLSSSELTEQERMSSLEILSFVKGWSANANERDRLRLQIEKFKLLGYISLFDRIDSLVEQIKGSEEKISPLGKGRFSLTRNILINKRAKEKEVLQLIRLLAQNGLCCGLHWTVLVNAKDYFEVFRVGVRVAPFPMIYYACQISDENMLRRVGQELANNEEIRSRLNEMLMRILESIPEAHENIQDALLLIAGELFISVPPREWQQGFLAVWKILLEEKKLWNRHVDAAESFVKGALRFLEDGDALVVVLRDLLGNLDGHGPAVISHLYELWRNVLFKGSLSNEVGGRINGELQSVISRIPQEPENSLFVLGNLVECLSTSQLNDISRELSKVDFRAIKDSNWFRVALHFVGTGPLVRAAVADAVITHSSLWASGVVGDTIHMPTPSLKIMELTDRRHRKGLTFTNAQAVAIFETLQRSVEALRPLVSTRVGSNEMLALYTEMKEFMDLYRDSLTSFTQFPDIYHFVETQYQNAIGYANIADGISHREKGAVILALADLSELAFHGELDVYAFEIHLNKVLLQCEPGLEAAINYLAAWIELPACEENFRSASRTLQAIVSRYWDITPDGADIPFLKEMFVRLSWGMRKIGIGGEIVDRWIDYGTKSTYNNVRQWVSAALTSDMKRE